MEPSSLGKAGVGGSEEDEFLSRKSRYLDVQSLYSSRALKEGKDNKKGGRKGNGKGNGELGKGKKRSVSNGYSSSSRAEGKKSRKNSDDQRNGNGAVRSRSVDLNDKLVPSLSQLQNSINSFVGVSLSLDHSGNFLRIPKRPRGSARRNRFESSSSLKEPARQSASVYKVGGVKDEVKKVEVHRVSVLPDTSVACASDQPSGKLLSSSASNAAKQNAKRKASSTEQIEIGNGIISAQRYKEKHGLHVIHNDDTSSTKRQSSHRKRKGFLSGSQTIAEKVENPESENGLISANHYKDEHGLYVKHNDNTSCTKRRSSHRKRKGFTSGSRTLAEKVENPVGECGSVRTNSPDDDDDEENLEQNAARMLSSRFDPSCTVFSAKMGSIVSPDTNGFSYMNSLAGSESPSVDNSSRVLRPRKQHSEIGLSRKRRHYYEISPRGLDAHWVLNRKIKVFWPLDKIWYYGLVSDYDPERKLHQIKYDDRDEEWVDLQGEKFKLLLLPDEIPGKAELKQPVGFAVADILKRSSKFVDDRQTENNLDSEPIIAWLSRSSRQVKQSPSSPWKKQKLLEPLTLKSHDNHGNANGNGHLLVRHGRDDPTGLTLCSSSGDDGSRAENSECSDTGKLVVYYRKKYRKNGGISSSAPETENISKLSPRSPKSHAEESTSLQTRKDHRDQLFWLLDDNGSLQLSMRLLESAAYGFFMCLSLLTLHGKLFGREQIWLSNTLFLSQYGTIISRWPIVSLEILIVDNIIGMKSLLFEGSLDHVSAFVFLILSAFNRQGEDCLLAESQLPVTSVRIRLSHVISPRKKQLFAFYNFLKLKSSKWLHLDSELKCRSLLTQQLPLSLCTYDNIKAFEGGNYRPDVPCSGSQQQDLQKITKQYMVPVCPSRVSCNSKMDRAAFSLAAMPGKLPPFAVSFSAAPTFFLNLHLKMLMRHSFACITPVEDDSSEVTESDCLVNEQDFCRALSLSRKDMEINSVSNVGSFSSCATSAGCLTTLLPHSEKLPASDVGFSTVSPQGLLKVDITKSSTLSKPIQTNATEEAITPEECELGYSHMQFIATSQSSIKKTSIPHDGVSSVGGMNVEIPLFDEVDRSPDERTCLLRQPSDWNGNMGYIESPNYTGPGSSLHCSRSSIDSPLQDLSPVWPDGKTNMVDDVFSNGPKKPRTQVQYTMSYGGNDPSSKQKLHQRSMPYKRIRRADECRNSNGFRVSRRNLEFTACDANVLVTSGDKGWRVYGARVVLELADHNECMLAIRISGVIKHSCKVKNILQWSTNRYTHAMMWKGGKDWALEFPDRSQWLLFKEIHEECLNRNIRAASVRHIPIPGVCLIEDIIDCANNMPFVRHPAKYFKQVENDVEMAMNPLRVLYDMDSEDELFVSENKRAACSNNENCGEISDELFEKTMDMFEKVAHAEKRDQFTDDEIDELAVGVGSTRMVKLMYEHWHQKRLQKGISLIRHLQPPLWEQYQQQVKEWEKAVARGNPAVSSLCQERPVLKEKPPMFPFCLRPRGLEIPNKGSKHRSHKKLSVSVHNHADLDAGRRLNGITFGEERILCLGNNLYSSEASPYLQASARGYSPSDASGFGCFSLGNNMSELKYPPMSHRNKRKKSVGGFPGTPPSVASHNQRTTGKRSSIHQWTMDAAEWPSHKYYQPEVAFSHNSQQFDGSDVQEFRLRDASGADRHAQYMAKIKRERAQRLMYRADMAIHKAVVAIMTAEAMKVATENSNSDG